MSAKKKTIIIAVIAILVVAFIAVAFLATQKSADYYMQIDNDCVTEIAPHGAMNYRYTLSAYDETGAEKELNFETSRILTDDAYGNEYLYVDEDMRLRLETKLIHSIVTGFKVLPV